MKILISILVLAVVGMGGYIAKDVLIDNDEPTTNSNQSSSSDTEVKKSGGKTLDLSSKGLIEVGPSIYDRSDVTELILSNNNLKSLKSEMGRMKNLQILKLDHNMLEGSLIGEIRQMSLVSLDVSYNKMTGIPAEIGQLTKLQNLDYSYNNIDSYPNEIGNIKQLKTLNLTGNPFSAQKIAEIKAKLPNTNVIF